NVAIHDNGRAVTLTLLNLTTMKETKLPSVKTREGRATFEVTRTEAASYALKAEAGTLMKGLTAGYGGTVADLVVEPGHTFGMRVTADILTLDKDAGYAWVSVQLLDPSGNVTTNQTGRDLVVTLDFANDTKGFTYGYFTVDDTEGGVQTWTRSVIVPNGSAVSDRVRFFGGTASGSRKISARLLDGTAATVTIATADVGAAAKVSIASVQPVVLDPWLDDDSAVDGQVVVVTALDAKGNRVSSYSGDLNLKAIDPDVRVVAVWDEVNRQWTSLDELPGNDLGDYAQEATIAADRGQARFLVRANTPGTKVYESTIGTAKATVTGRFDPQ
ncbi:MAG TPA: hypothetical protein VD902_12500, partial [Symbiobacteriaceae bacterium]|nr:hypothetical protein [Symbiobacteriaceae bacterium]